MDKFNTGQPPKPMASVKRPEQPIAAQATADATMQDVSEMLEQIASYGGLGKSLKRERMMQEISAEIARIAEVAEQAVVNEAEDWFDKHTVSRNMKEIKAYAKDFAKLAEESDMLHQRMSALYEDMGRILERYFELPQEHGEEAGVVSEIDSEMEEEMGESVEQHVAVGLPQTKEKKSKTESVPPKKTKSSGSSPYHIIADNAGKVDELTIRAIRAVHEELKKTNPEFAKRFAKLPPKKMIEAVWKLVK
jgi:hypothetical protein